MEAPICGNANIKVQGINVMASSKSGNMSCLVPPLTHRPLSPDIVMRWVSGVGLHSADTTLPLCAERRFRALCRNAKLDVGSTTWPCISFVASSGEVLHHTVSIESGVLPRVIQPIVVA